MTENSILKFDCNIANKLQNVLHIELEPYHTLGEGKYMSLGLAEHKFNSPGDKEKENWLSEISVATDKKAKFA